MEHETSDRRSSAGASLGLRTLAVFESAKGAMVLLLGCGVLHLILRNFDYMSEAVADVLHISTEARLSNLFVELASHTTDRTLWVLALGALVYAVVRFIEAYGLWQEREWAQWFGLLSTASYLPAELYWLLRHPSSLKSGVLGINLVIVLFMLSLRVKGVRRPQRSRETL